MLVHLLGQLARQLDRLNVRPECTPEKALEEALDLALDGAQDAHVPEAVSRLRVATGPVRERRESAAEDTRAEHDRERRDEWGKADHQRDRAEAHPCGPLAAAAPGIGDRVVRECENPRDDDETDVVLNDDR